MSWYLFRIYRHSEDTVEGRAIRVRHLTDRWFFTPFSLGGFSYRTLILVSLLGLFFELLIIRWISCEIRIFAYFKNFVLIACFLGFGVGCYLNRRPIHLFLIVMPILLIVLLIVVPIPSLRYIFDYSLAVYLGGFSEVHIWGVPSVPMNAEWFIKLTAVIGVVVPLFILISLMFVPLGQLLGWLLEKAPNGITGYTLNILASLAGILLYTVLCFLEQGPMVWFAVAGCILVMLVWKIKMLRWTSLFCFLLCIGLLGLDRKPNEDVFWSPYQKLVISPEYAGTGETIRYNLTTNNAWYQQIIDLSDDFVEAHPGLFSRAPVALNPYNLPYLFYPAEPGSVLVLGSGMGNDVAAALRNGAKRIVAVEIDPTILKLGQQLHFEKPYDSSKVEMVVDDARSYIEKTSDRFDLITFALLDSHTTSSYYSNIRIDNYVYTREAMEATRRLLKPGGILVLKFQDMGTPWISGRLEGLLTEVFGYPPLRLKGVGPYSSKGRFFVTGSKEHLDDLISDEEFLDYVGGRSQFEIQMCTLTTDDWPYFYQQEPGLPAGVIIISVVLIVVCALALGGTGTTVRFIQWHFFFLGAGFLLLEVHIISKMALLFGTTWLVNSIVIAGLLLMIVGANQLVMIVPRIPRGVAYWGLFISILVSYLLPPDRLFLDPLWLRLLVASAVLCIPVFFAGIIFIKSFARTGFSGLALGSNLFGALVGGLLESLSLWTGIKALLVVGALLYLLSLLSIRSVHRMSGQPGDTSSPKIAS